MFELRPGGFEHRHGVAELRLAAAPALHQSQRPKRYPDRPRRSPLAGQLEFFASELGRLFGTAEQAHGQRSLGAPLQSSRIPDPERVHHRTDHPELVQGRLGCSRL